MAQPEFHRPECFDGSTTDEIHERMMASLPDDIDDMPAGFPYDFTRPAAEEKSEFINYHLIRADIDIPTEDKNEMGGVDDE